MINETSVFVAGYRNGETSNWFITYALKHAEGYIKSIKNEHERRGIRSNYSIVEFTSGGQAANEKYLKPLFFDGRRVIHLCEDNGLTNIDEKSQEDIFVLEIITGEQYHTKIPALPAYRDFVLCSTQEKVDEILKHIKLFNNNYEYYITEFKANKRGLHHIFSDGERIQRSTDNLQTGYNIYDDTFTKSKYVLHYDIETDNMYRAIVS